MISQAAYLAFWVVKVPPFGKTISPKDTPGRPVSRIVKIFTACPEVNRNREPKWGISNLANSIHGFSILYLVLLKAASSR